jgi:hypothetical protein
VELEQLIADIRATLGIDENADPVATIAQIRTERDDARAAVEAAGRGAADQAELINLRRELQDARTQYLRVDGEAQRQIAQIRNEMREASADAEIDRLVATGRVRSVARSHARSLYLSTPAADWPNVVALFPSLDLEERGVASGSELAELELTEQDIANAKALGNWNAQDPKGSRLELMKAKAAAKGWQLPEDYK